MLSCCAGARRPPWRFCSAQWRLLHPAAIRPGFVLFLGLLGYTGFLTFAAVHAEDVGIANTGTVFTVFAAVVIVLRTAGARIPDRLGPVNTGAVAVY